MGTLTDRLGLPCHRGLRIVVTRAHGSSTVKWLVLASGSPERFAKAQASTDRLLEGVRHAVDIGDSRQGHAPYLGPAARKAIVDCSASNPDLLLSSRRDDAHQDRRVRTILRLHGIEFRASDGVAEGPICRKLVV